MQHMSLRARQLTAAAPGAGLEFVKAMWGCLFAGVVAVPVCPPNPLTLQTLRDTLPHFQRILDDSGAVAILTDSQISLVSPAVSLSQIFRTPQLLSYCAASKAIWTTVGFAATTTRRAD